MDAQNRLVQSSLVETKRTLNVYERDAMRASEEIEAIDADVKAEIELLQSSTDERIATREAKAVAVRAEKMAQVGAAPRAAHCRRRRRPVAPSVALLPEENIPY